MNNDNPKFFNHEEFSNPFVADLRRARALVIIQSPYLTVRRVEFFQGEFRACNKRGVRVCVVAQQPKEWEQRRDLAKHKVLEVAIQLLQNLDVHVTLSPGVHEKLAIIDEEILWDGSMNILSYFDTKERMGRWVSRDLVKQVIAKHNLDLCAACSARLPLPLLPVNDDESEVKSRQLIGRFIEQRRCELGMSQAELGRASSTPQDVISEIELGKRNLKYDRLSNIAVVLQFRMLPIPWHLSRKVVELLDYKFSVAPVKKTVPATHEKSVSVPDEISELESRQLIGKLIARRRDELGLSQKAVGQASRTFQVVVSDIELGRRNAKYEALYRIAAVLEMHLLPINAPFSGKVAEMMMGDSFCAQPPASKVGTGMGTPSEAVVTAGHYLSAQQSIPALKP